MIIEDPRDEEKVDPMVYSIFETTIPQLKQWYQELDTFDKLMKQALIHDYPNP